MRLEKILSQLNSLEKNSFIKIIDNIIASNPKNAKAIDRILEDPEKDLKSLDNVIITKIFDLVKDEFSELVKAEFVNTSSQLDVLSDIIIRDGNCIMKRDWFAKLYESELKEIIKSKNQLNKELTNSKSELTEARKRYYEIYRKCVKTAFYNDEKNKREEKITDDELSILLVLAHELQLSQNEVKLLNYLIVDPKLMEIDDTINYLKKVGVLFYSKKARTIYIADELVRLLRKIRKKEIADKFLRRVLKLLREPQINLIARKHNIDWKQPLNAKIKSIINEGISLSVILEKDLYKDETKLSYKKKFLNDLWSKSLGMNSTLKGYTLNDKIDNIINHFNKIEKDEKVGISIDGYEKLLSDLSETLPHLNEQIKTEFEFQDENVLRSRFLLDYNIKPRDILDLIASGDIIKFCKEREIKTRGNDIDNILSAYKDAQNLYLENYENIGFRDLAALRENGIRIKEADLGAKFEKLTKVIFTQLGFNVDESLKRQLNNRKNKIDILINLGNKEIIIVECKTVKESGYNKFSSVSRQMKAYIELAKSKNYKIVKTLLIAPDFSDPFVEDTEYDYDLNLSLITASALRKILEAFKTSEKHKKFPYKLLLKDVMIQEDRVIKAIEK